MSDENPLATRTVYSLYYPETRAIVDELWEFRPHGMYERAYTKKQDQLHEPFLATWREWSGLGLGDAFPHAYPTNGASEAIDHLIVPPGRVHVFDGEYEGYSRIAEARGMEVRRYRREPAPLALISRPPSDRITGLKDTFFVSIPSAIDGEYWDGFEEFCESLARTNPEIDIVVDVTYVGAVKNLQLLDLARHENVSAVVFSLSKPFGVYYHRIGGVVSRRPIPSLWGNLWFKNLFSLELGTRLMQRYAVDELPREYAVTQRLALTAAKEKYPAMANATLSNVVLLARSSAGEEEFARTAGKYRYCLTPAMDAMINGGVK